MSNPIDPRKVFIVLPAYNEQAVITTVVRELQGFGYSIVVVDDGSQPPLAPLLAGMPVYLLRHRVNLGQGAALQTGISFAGSKNADYIVSFDADGQHRAEDIARLLDELNEGGLDIVTGTRFMEGSGHNMTKGRKIVIQTARYLNWFFTGLLLSDAHNGLRAMTGEAAKKIQLQESGMAHATEFISIIRKQKLRFKEVPVQVRYTEYSRSKGQSAWSGFRILFDILLNKIFK